MSENGMTRLPLKVEAEPRSSGLTRAEVERMRHVFDILKDDDCEGIDMRTLSKLLKLVEYEMRNDEILSFATEYSTDKNAITFEEVRDILEASMEERLLINKIRIELRRIDATGQGVISCRDAHDMIGHVMANERPEQIEKAKDRLLKHGVLHYLNVDFTQIVRNFSNETEGMGYPFL
jgi:Ca2+-binding EF-hand superfamily protein